MRMISLLVTLVLGLGLGSALSAQCPAPVAPGLEIFDSLTPPVANPVTGILNLTALPAGWTHNTLGFANSWRTWSGPPPSYFGNSPNGQTGPVGDHTTEATTGTGIYLYTETSSPNAFGDTAVVEVCYDLTTLALPALSFWYHMNGTEIGTLFVEQSLDGGATWPVQLFTASGNLGNQWNVADGLILTPDLSGQAHLRFRAVSVGSWRGDMAIDDVAVGNAYFATNDANGHIDIDGREGTSVAPLNVNMITTSCGGNFATLNLKAAAPGAFYEVGLNTTSLVGPGAPILGDTLNISVPGITFLNSGGALPLLFQMPGGQPPFNGPSFWGSTFIVSSAFDLSAQAVFTAPPVPSGWVLSAPFELHVTLASGVSPFPGPSTITGDDSSVIVDLTSPTTCFSGTGFSFNGTSYTTLSVESNGRIMFGNFDHDFSATAGEAQAGSPFIGFWSDLTPLTAVTISNPSAAVLRVDYNGVRYFGQATPLISFAVEIDDANQEYHLDGLTGILPNPVSSSAGDNQFLGLSVGAIGGATDPGLTFFTVGGTGTTGAATDMLYDFYDNLAIPATGLVPSLMAGTLNKITFFALAPGFAWSGL